MTTFIYNGPLLLTYLKKVIFKTQLWIKVVAKVDLLKYSAATMTPQELAGVSRDKEAVRERALIRRNLRKLVLPR
jgi:hypothetical protein